MTSGFVINYHQSGENWKSIDLPVWGLIIGRGDECDLILSHNLISRNHLKITREDNTVFVTDLGSTNGSRLNGKRLEAHIKTRLLPDQILVLGDAEIKLSDLRQTRGVLSPISEPPAVREQSLRLTPPVYSGFNLRYRYGTGNWQDFILPHGEVVIGRYIGADLFLDAARISRRHVRLTVSGETVAIQDLGSTNGTLLDGQPMAPRKQYIIQSHQEFAIGDFIFRLQGAPQDESGPMTMIRDLGEYLTHEDKQQLWGSRVDLRALNFQQKDRFSIGRSSDNDIVLDHPLVSRFHALIEKMGARFRLRDLESTNGVFVNGTRIKDQAWLKDGDTITVGASDFVLTGSNLQCQVELGLNLIAQRINQFVKKDLNLLKDISLNIHPMEFVALVGMSGAGKSTLMNALSGYWPASHGRVLVNGINLYEHYDFFRNDIGYVPQKDIVHTELTPSTALEYVARLRLPPDTSAGERRKLVDEVLSDLDLTERRDLPISRLSGGQLKRVSIGVELLTKPRMFFLDEPTSGLDPGTEYEMMKLLRHLADQGRTVVLITHATKNVMMCDKVIFLARGGYVAYYGAPEKALAYFDQYRTKRERREKHMEFDDIYIVLNDEERGKPEDWGQRYLESEDSRELIMEAQSKGSPRQSNPLRRSRVKRKAKVSALRQFLILSSRNLRILFQDKISLALMLVLAPAIGLMDFIWGTKLFDPVEGDATKIITMWFMAALITVLVGAISSVREIVKEVEIYKRERAVNLKVAPYVFSKVWVGFVLALYQAGVLLFFKILFVRPNVSSLLGYPAFYLTLFIGTLCGYFVGLAISAGAPNQNAAMMLIIIVLVPQFLFAGALLPLDLIPGGKLISVIMPTRWAFESFVKLSGIGDQLADDLCWAMNDEGRKTLTDELKLACPCMGESIFEDCAEFPGILSADFYDQKVQEALNSEKPLEPEMPTAYPSLTPLATPTRLPSPTPNPTPENPQNMGDYMDLQEEQGIAYQDEIMGQMEVYREDSVAQGEVYADLRNAQGDEYQEEMQVYGDERAAWQKSREKAISSAEGLLESIYDNFGQAFSGSVFGRWVTMSFIMLLLLVLVLILQKRKDVV
ncbi:MAG: FHA domain-containing protein [Anaerolineaceae bacterium]|nr:FHA domain-containing protein [Anaerolineaceae bacterium]